MGAVGFICSLRIVCFTFVSPLCMQPEPCKALWRGCQEVTAGLPVTFVAPSAHLVPVSLGESAQVCIPAASPSCPCYTQHVALGPQGREHSEAYGNHFGLVKHFLRMLLQEGSTAHMGTPSLSSLVLSQFQQFLSSFPVAAWQQHLPVDPVASSRQPF